MGIKITAGNGLVFIDDIKTGGTDTATIYNNTVYGAGEYEWPSSLIGHLIGEQKPLHINLSDELRSELVRIVKEVSLEAFHPKSDSIPIGWIHDFALHYMLDNNDHLSDEDLELNREIGRAILRMVDIWEEENEAN